MDKKKLLKVTIIVSLVLIIIFLVVQLFLKKDKKTEIETYSVQTAKKAAEATLTSFEGWRGPALEEWYTFYDLEKKPSAYLFNVSDYYGKAGYITISATTKLDPVVEVSDSAETPVTIIIKQTNDITIGTFYKPSDVKAEYIYLGGNEYYTKLTLREGSDLIEEYYMIKGSVITKVDEEQVLAKQEFYSTYKEENSEENWDKILNP